MATLKDTIINGNLTVNGDIKGGDCKKQTYINNKHRI